MTLPLDVPLVTLTYGAHTNAGKEPLKGGTMSITPQLARTHLASGSYVDRSAVRVDLSGGVASAEPVVASDAAGFNVDGNVLYTIKFEGLVAADGSLIDRPALTNVALPGSVPVVDVDMLAAGETESGVVINFPSVIGVAGYSGSVSVEQLMTALDAQLTAKIEEEGDARYAGRVAAAPVALQSLAVSAVSGVANSQTNYPTLTRQSSAWIPLASQGAPSMLWACPVDMRGWPGALDNIYVYYSTDHGTDSATTGVHLITMTEPDGTGLTYRGRVLNIIGSATWTQPETPAVWLDWRAGVVRMLFQVNTGVTPSGEPQSEQITRMATSVNGRDTWTDVGIAFARPSATTPGVAHCGYANPWRLGDTWYAYTLMGGSAGGMCTEQLWRSDRDGLPGTWSPIGGRIGGGDLLVDIPGFAMDWVSMWQTATIIDYRGRLWWIGQIGTSTAGLEDGARRDLYAAPLRSDLRSWSARPVKITPPRPSGGWGDDLPPGSLGRAMSYDGETYLPFRMAGKTTDWGLYRLDMGSVAA